MNAPSSLLRIFYGLMRTAVPTIKLRNYVFLSRYDQVKEVLNNAHLYRAPYQKNLDTVTGGTHDFILGMDPGGAYDKQRKLLMNGVYSEDLTEYIPARTSTEMEKLIGSSNEVEVVSLVRRVTSRTLLAYFGMGENLPDETLVEYEELALNIFKYQFMDDGNDEKTKEVAAAQGQRLNALIEEQLRLARQSSLSDKNLLGRYLTLGKSENELSDEQIITALFGFIVGGLPQPPMVAPNAINELIKRPDALAMAMDAAETNEAELEAIFFEALRFDPLAPMLKRIVVEDTILAAGTNQERKLEKGDQLVVMFASAMQDGRRLEKPKQFNQNRPSSSYMHFGYGHHECFAAVINRKMLPAMVKPILKSKALNRAEGKKGNLVKADFAFPQKFYLNLA